MKYNFITIIFIIQFDCKFLFWSGWMTGMGFHEGRDKGGIVHGQDKSGNSQSTEDYGGIDRTTIGQDGTESPIPDGSGSDLWKKLYYHQLPRNLDCELIAKEKDLEKFKSVCLILN